MIRRTSVAALILALGATTAHAGGAWLYEMGTPDLGTAAAGRAALAMDASTAWGNPAGMMMLDGTQLMLGFQPTYVKTEFAPGPTTDVTGNDGGNAGGFAPVLSANMTHRFGTAYSVGLSIGSSLASALTYDEDWIGRYYVERTEITTMTLNPVFAMRLEKWFSVGVGMSVVFGRYDESSAVNNEILDPGFGDGQILFEGKATGLGANIGILLEPENGARIGLTYRSPVTLGFEDAASASAIGPNLGAVLDTLGLTIQKVDADVTLPQDIMLSLYHPVGEHALLFNSGWQRWEEFAKANISIESDTAETITATQLLQDTWHFAFGLHYRLSEPWLLMGGFAYDTSASTDENRTLDLPLDRQYRYSAGATWTADEQTSLSGGYQFADLGAAKVDQSRLFPGTVAGEYSSNNAHFFSVSVNRTF